MSNLIDKKFLVQFCKKQIERAEQHKSKYAPPSDPFDTCFWHGAHSALAENYKLFLSYIEQGKFDADIEGVG